MKRTHFLLLIILVTFKAFTQDGTLDISFSTNLQGIWPNKIVELPSSKILIGGSLLNPDETKALKRLHADGSVDNTFVTVATSNSGLYGEIKDFIVSDNKILIGGDITNVNGFTVGNIALLNANDGSSDHTFNAGIGFNDVVFAVAVQADGKFIVAGSFTSYKGKSVNRIVRLNRNGTLDAGFNFTPLGNEGPAVRYLYIEPTGKILVGASFTTPAKGIYRLNIDGTIDPTFNTGGTGVTGVNKGINFILPTTDGKYILGGNFDGYNGVPLKNIVRINSNGTIDNSFVTGTGFSSYINSMDLQDDGKIIVVGLLNTYNGAPIRGIVRLNSNGTLDNSFNQGGTGLPNTSTRVDAVKVTSNGKILVGALFPASYNGTNVGNVFRLNNTSVLPAIGLKLSGKKSATAVTLTWQTLSEFNTKAFAAETSIDGINYRKIGIVSAAGTSTHFKEYKLQVDNDKLTAGEIYFRVLLKDNSGEINYSNTIILQNSNSGHFKLYPNPAADYTLLSFPQQIKAAAVEVYDIQGRIVINNKINAMAGGQYRLSTSQLLPGSYIVHLKTDDGIIYQRLLIHK